MASSFSPFYMRILHRFLPCLFRRCIGKNYHWRWDRICWCCVGEHFQIGDKHFHGGIYDMKTQREYQLCKQCRISS